MQRSDEENEIMGHQSPVETEQTGALPSCTCRDEDAPHRQEPVTEEGAEPDDTDKRVDLSV